jgi:hypothetical protein
MYWKKNKEKEFSYLISLEIKRKKFNQLLNKKTSYSPNQKSIVTRIYSSRYILQEVQSYKFTSKSMKFNQLEDQISLNYEVNKDAKGLLRSKENTDKLSKLEASCSKAILVNTLQLR